MTKLARSTVVIGGLVLTVLVGTRWLRVNLSPSQPLGLYRLAPVPAVLERGTLVVVPVPARVRHVWSSWVPLLKPVAAVAGDVVCVVEETLWIGGVSYGPVYHAAQERTLPRLAEGCFQVQDGTVLLASTAPRSLDGRYYGPTPLSTLTAQALPLFTWR